MLPTITRKLKWRINSLAYKFYTQDGKNYLASIKIRELKYFSLEEHDNEERKWKW